MSAAPGTSRPMKGYHTDDQTGEVGMRAHPVHEVAKQATHVSCTLDSLNPAKDIANGVQ
jgi:hypothetical protein